MSPAMRPAKRGSFTNILRSIGVASMPVISVNRFAMLARSTSENFVSAGSISSSTSRSLSSRASPRAWGSQTARGVERPWPAMRASLREGFYHFMRPHVFGNTRHSQNGYSAATGFISYTFASRLAAFEISALHGFLDALQLLDVVQGKVRPPGTAVQGCVPPRPRPRICPREQGACLSGSSPSPSPPSEQSNANGDHFINLGLLGGGLDIACPQREPHGIELFNPFQVR